ncbi:MAG: tRNA lysidine(34) synthetase TilS [Hyphomicrobiaceae bacterium]
MDADAPITDDEIRALFEPVLTAPVALAVSGGVDSMALMHVAQRALALLPPSPGTLQHPDRPRLIVLTVDHGLRPGSAEDAAWVAVQAEAAGLPCRVLTWTGEKPTHGIQAAARAARYHLMHGALIEEARPFGGVERKLLTAHHCEDQAETFLMRLARGSGIDGLSAMQRVARIPAAPVTDSACGAGVTVVRPLLDLPKSRLVATLREAGLEWREDPSNEQADFERVRVRKALTSLSDLGIASEAIARSAKRISRARSAIERAAREAAHKCVAWHDGQFGSVPVDALCDFSEEIAIRILRLLISAYGGEAPDPQLSEIELLAERIRATSARPWPARAATLGGCRLDWRPGGELRVWREAGRVGLPTLQVLPGDQAVVWDRRFLLSAAAELDGPIEVRALDAAGWRALKAERPDLGKLRLPPGAATTLPGCWRGSVLLAVPGLPAPSSPLIRAEFLGARARPLI